MTPDRKQLCPRQGLEQAAEHLQTAGALGSRRCSIRVGLQRPVRMPWKRVPKDGGALNAEFAQCRPQYGGRWLTPRPHSRRDTRPIVSDAGNLPGDQQSLAGKWDPADAAALIAWRLTDQQMCRLHVQMRRKPLAARAWAISAAVIRIAIGPGIEDVFGAVTLQKPQKPTGVSAHGLAGGIPRTEAVSVGA